MAPSPPCPRRPDARSLRGAIALVVLAAWIHVAAFASSVPLDVYAGADTTALEPGKLAPRNIVVRNRGTGPVELIEEIGLPRGWSRLATLDEVFALAAGETAVRVVALSVPGSEPEGRKAIRYRLKDRSNNVVVWEGEFPVTVRAIARLAVSWSELPSGVVAGEPLPLAVTLVNRGNCPVDVEIEGESYPAAGPPLRRKI
ncbi:MAG: hypothetical protein JNL97_08440, partial [Verrucomicrobiales bacterium]|nr:hypothetical protein [Verrucomicrobiales bacterium]